MLVLMQAQTQVLILVLMLAVAPGLTSSRACSAVELVVLLADWAVSVLSAVVVQVVA
jgi:hypothetical protein